MKTFNIQNLIRENIKSMKPYSSARDEFWDFDKNIVYLDANENPNYNGVNRYPDPQQKSLKAVLAKIKKISENQVLLGNGSDEIIDLIFRTFCEPYKDNIITLPPTYGMYGVLANLNAIENREVILNEFFEPQTDLVLSKVDSKTKIIFLCSPNNPTGNIFPEDSITKLLKKFSGIVVLDEAYIDFSDKVSWLKKINDYPNLVIIQTLSKAYGMAGIRVGILYASPEIIAIINKIKPPYNVNVLSQNKAITQLKNQKNVQQQIDEIKDQRNLVYGHLLNTTFVKEIYTTDANFILCKVDDAKQRYQQLLEKGIVVRNRTQEILCENCIRITIGTNQENQKLITVLTELDL